MNFIPYGKQQITQEDITCVVESLKYDLITTGAKVQEFENALSKYCGARYVVVVSSGTAALHLASLAILNKDDKVLTTPNSFLATSNSILYAKANPVFIDICENGNINLDLCEVELKKDNSIKAIYAVSFSGKMLDQQKLKYLKETYNITILEDNAHSIGAMFDGTKAGSCENSDVSIFSFHPVKHITTGEGGAISTNSHDVYEKLLRLRSHGAVKTKNMKPWEYEMQDLGFNYRITDIQCALGLSQLHRLDTFVKRRIELAKKYDNAFKETLVTPLYLYDGNSSYHLYVVRICFNELNISKEELFTTLQANNIGVQLHYMPINKQPYYKTLGYSNENTPVMDKYYEDCLSLPMYSNLSDTEQTYVIKTVLEILNA